MSHHCTSRIHGKPGPAPASAGAYWGTGSSSGRASLWEVPGRGGATGNLSKIGLISLQLECKRVPRSRQCLCHGRLSLQPTASKLTSLNTQPRPSLTAAKSGTD